MRKFMKSLLLSAIAVIPTVVSAGDYYRVGTRVNTDFTAIQGETVDIQVGPELIGKFWMNEGHIYKAYQEGNSIVVREVLIDVVDSTRPNAATPAGVSVDENGHLLVRHGRYTLRHDPLWRNLTRRDYLGTGRYVQAPNPVLPGVLPSAIVPEAIPVDTVVGRVMDSEWIVVQVHYPVWLKGTIEEIVEPQPTPVLPRARINGISPTPDPAFQQEEQDEYQPVLPAPRPYDQAPLLVPPTSN